MVFEELDADATAADESFSRENGYTLRATVDGSLFAKAGSMIAYTGDLSFTGQATAEGGLTGMLKEAATGEGTPVMVAEGDGVIYLADNEKKVQIISLGPGETITVNGEDVLAFESGLDYEIGSIDSLAGSLAGGFTNVHLSGPGLAAITAHGDPVVLERPVTTDPSATVAWSGPAPSIDIETGLSDMIGQESGERIQMEFAAGDGAVVVQPYEELGPG